MDDEDETEEQVLNLDVIVGDTDGWCEACALPSMVTLQVVLMNADGVQPVGSMRFCAEEIE